MVLDHDTTPVSEVTNNSHETAKVSHQNPTGRVYPRETPEPGELVMSRQYFPAMYEYSEMV